MAEEPKPDANVAEPSGAPAEPSAGTQPTPEPKPGPPENIPYGRFKEVNDASKGKDVQIQQLQAEKAQRDAQMARIKQKAEQYDTLDQTLQKDPAKYKTFTDLIAPEPEPVIDDPFEARTVENERKTAETLKAQEARLKMQEGRTAAIQKSQLDTIYDGAVANAVNVDSLKHLEAEAKDPNSMLHDHVNKRIHETQATDRNWVANVPKFVQEYEDIMQASFVARGGKPATPTPAPPAPPVGGGGGEGGGAAPAAPDDDGYVEGSGLDGFRNTQI